MHIRYTLILYVQVIHQHMFYAPHVCLVPMEATKKNQIHWNWCCRWLWATIWVMGTEPRSSAGVTSALTTKPLQFFILPNILWKLQIHVEVEKTVQCFDMKIYIILNFTASHLYSFYLLICLLINNLLFVMHVKLSCLQRIIYS